MQSYGAVRQRKAATMLFEQQNIHNNSDINDNNNNNFGKRTLKYTAEYFKYGWRGTTYHLTAYCPRLIIAPVSYHQEMNCAKWYAQVICDYKRPRNPTNWKKCGAWQHFHCDQMAHLSTACRFLANNAWLHSPCFVVNEQTFDRKVNKHASLLLRGKKN